LSSWYAIAAPPAPRWRLAGGATKARGKRVGSSKMRTSTPRSRRGAAERGSAG
jgi:hypothetical protein